MALLHNMTTMAAAAAADLHMHQHQRMDTIMATDRDMGMAVHTATTTTTRILMAATVLHNPLQAAAAQRTITTPYMLARTASIPMFTT